MAHVAGRFIPAYDPSRAAININTSGDNIIVAAPATGSRLYIWHFNLVTTTAQSVTLKDGAAGTAISGAYAFSDNGGIAWDSQTAGGPLILSDNKAFVINLSGNIQVSGFVLYTTNPTAGN